ncbi:MFS general substrate transporter, partial [Amylocystis lapponica]
ALNQVSFFVIVSSSSLYAEHLGGTQTFSGLVIGIPTVFSGLALLPLMKIDQHGYKRPLHFACGSALLGNLLYSLAYRANWLYLILIGRIVSGFGFTFWMYAKRYCSDSRIVGVRRRTTLAGWLVLGQGAGFTIGPFFGGLLYKVGFSNSLFNGYTSPTWIMAGIWAVFWAVAAMFFEDVPATPPTPALVELSPVRDPERPDPSETTLAPEATSASAATESDAALLPPQTEHMTGRRWGVVVTMCWFAMTCFFVLGAWEANIPIYTGSPASPLAFGPFAAGNLIALGGLCTAPFLLLNLALARRVQDRHTLAAGAALGLAGLLAALVLLRAHAVAYGALFACWFLVALGFNVASTCTLSLLSKQLPGAWNTRTSLAIQYSNYVGRVAGGVWGGAGVKVGMVNYVGMQVAVVGIGGVLFSTLWRSMKAKTG